MRKNNYAPFIHTEKTAPFIYVNVVVALVPCICIAVANYGLRALALILISVMLFFVFDVVFSRLLNNSDKTNDYYDLSSLISGAIFALMLPPDSSIFVVILGVLFGSFAVKQFFGGVGSNLVNPAIAARLFVQLVIPDAMTGFAKPFANLARLDTLLNLTKTSGTLENVSDITITEVFFGNFSSYIGTGCGILILVGFSYLLLKKLVRGYAFAGYVIAILIFYPLMHITTFFSGSGLREFFIFIISSGVLFIAAFALGDFTTMPMNPLMRFLAGSICAVITLLIYNKVDNAVALCAPVILVNIFTPSLDFFASTFTHKEIQTVKRGEDL